MLKRQVLLQLSLLVVFVGLGSFYLFAAQPSQAESTKDINTLMVERRDVLVKLVEILRNRHQQGIIPIDTFYQAQNDLLSVELELAKTREDRLAALNSQLTNFRSLEQRALELQKVGTRGGEPDAVLTATAQRLKVEIQILREQSVER